MAKRKVKTNGKPKTDPPPLRLEYRTPAELKENPSNWRTHPDAQVAALGDVIADVGWAGACLFNERTGRLIDGHARKKVAMTRGDKRVPVLVGSWTEEQERKILATLDPISAMATADAAKLQALLAEVAGGSAAIDAMLRDLADRNPLPITPGGGGDDFDGVDPEVDDFGAVRPKLGDVWVVGGRHRVACGDSTDAAVVGRLMAGNLAALIVTSPPYNQNIDKFHPSGMHKEGNWVAKVERLAYADSMPEPDYQDWQRRFIALWFDHTTGGGSLFYNHKHRYRDKRVLSPMEWLPGPWTWRQEIIWRRPGSVTQNARMFLPSDERIYWLYKGDDFNFDDSTEHKTYSTVWEIGLETNKNHAVGYPIELPSRPIRACSKTGEIIADPFLGSGTTLIAAHRLGRTCYGLEIEPKYVEVILRRCEAEGLSVELEK